MMSGLTSEAQEAQVISADVLVAARTLDEYRTRANQSSIKGVRLIAQYPRRSLL